MFGKQKEKESSSTAEKPLAADTPAAAPAKAAPPAKKGSSAGMFAKQVPISDCNFLW